jgi:hypothetical protein
MRTHESILKNELQKKIEEFANEQSSTDEWFQTGIYVSEETVGEMTNAAWSVFKGIYTALEYAKKKGVFEQ